MSTIITSTFSLFQYDFIVRAFIAGVIIGIIAPIIGTFLVVRRYALIADTLAHVSLMGVALGFVAGLNPLSSALVVSTLSAVGIEKLRKDTNLYSETLLAMVLSGSLAVAMVLISLSSGFTGRLFAYLFGNITTVTTQDISYIIGLGICVLAVVVILFRQLYVISLDEELAEASGLPVRMYNTILLMVTGVTVSLAMRIVGVLLVGALMVIPVITAMRYGYGFKKTMALSVGFSLLSVVLGLFLSYYLNIASGGTIVIIALVFFAASLVNKG